jgi:hypothetical protein
MVETEFIIAVMRNAIAVMRNIIAHMPLSLNALAHRSLAQKQKCVVDNRGGGGVGGGVGVSALGVLVSVVSVLVSAVPAEWAVVASTLGALVSGVLISAYA